MPNYAIVSMKNTTRNQAELWCKTFITSSIENASSDERNSASEKLSLISDNTLNISKYQVSVYSMRCRTNIVALHEDRVVYESWSYRYCFKIKMFIINLVFI